MKVKTMIRDILFLFCKKRVNFSNDNIEKICISKSALSVFSLSTNPVISFKYRGQLYFFRECHQVDNKQIFFEKAIVRFFDFLELQKVDKEIFKEEIPIRISFSENEVIRFKEYILHKKQERQFYRKIIHADKISERIGFNIWLTQSYDITFFSIFGFDDLASDLFDIAILFLWHMRSSALQFRHQKISVYSGFSFFSASKTIASKIVAEELGVSHIIVDAKPVYLLLDGVVALFGILTPKAPGCRAHDVQLSVNSMLQKELHDLYLLDNICLQTDHGPDNYNIYCDAESCYISAFDNDNPYAFSPLPYIKKSIVGCSSCIDDKGKLSCPFISKELFEKIRNVNFAGLKHRLIPYINKAQVDSLIYRIRIIQKAMMKAQDDGALILLENNDWNEEILQMELSGAFGETYLTKLMKVIGK